MNKTKLKKALDILNRIKDVVGYILIFAIVALCVIVLVNRSGGGATFIFGKTTAWVMTASMEPAIPERSYILLEKRDPATIEVGDIITFSSDDPVLKSAYNTHRVIEVIGDHAEFRTQGDANPVADGYTAKADKILGVYVRNLPVLTSIGRVLTSGIGTLVAVSFLLLIILAIYLPGMLKANKQRSEELEKRRRERIDELVREEVEKLRERDRLAAENGAATDDNDSENNTNP